MNIVQLKKLQYEEVAKCTRCGFCLPNCPTYAVRRTEAFTARGRNAITRAVIEGRLELSSDLAQVNIHLLGLRRLHQRMLPRGKNKGRGSFRQGLSHRGSGPSENLRKARGNP